MKHRLRTLIAIAVCVPAVWADGNNDKAHGATRATILPPIKIKKIQDLWFGEIILNGANMMVDTFIEQDADKTGGTRSADLPSFLTVVKRFEKWHNAKFEITGNKDTAFTCVIPQPVVTLRNTTGGTAILCLDQTRFNSYMGGAALDGSGKATIWVGGKLTLSGTQNPGLYSADFEVGVAYY